MPMRSPHGFLALLGLSGGIESLRVHHRPAPPRIDELDQQAKVHGNAAKG